MRCASSRASGRRPRGRTEAFLLYTGNPRESSPPPLRPDDQSKKTDWNDWKICEEISPPIAATTAAQVSTASVGCDASRRVGLRVVAPGRVVAHPSAARRTACDTMTRRQAGRRFSHFASNLMHSGSSCPVLAVRWLPVGSVIERFCSRTLAWGSVQSGWNSVPCQMLLVLFQPTGGKATDGLRHQAHRGGSRESAATNRDNPGQRVENCPAAFAWCPECRSGRLPLAPAGLLGVLLPRASGRAGCRGTLRMRGGVPGPTEKAILHDSVRPGLAGGDLGRSDRRPCLLDRTWPSVLWRGGDVTGGLADRGGLRPSSAGGATLHVGAQRRWSGRPEEQEGRAEGAVLSRTYNNKLA